MSLTHAIITSTGVNRYTCHVFSDPLADIIKVLVDPRDAVRRNPKYPRRLAI